MLILISLTNWSFCELFPQQKFLRPFKWLQIFTFSKITLNLAISLTIWYFFSLPDHGNSQLPCTSNIFLPDFNKNFFGNSSQMTHEYDFYNNHDFSISFTNKSFFTHNLMPGTENVDENFDNFLISLWCPVDSFYELKYSSNDEFFTIEILQLMDKINLFETKFDNVIYSIHTKRFVYQPSLSSLILLLSGDRELNPGRNQGSSNPWSPFDNKGLHFFHLNINSILPKIDELRQIAENTKSAIIGITESKLDPTIFDPEITIEGFVSETRWRSSFYIRKDIYFNPMRTRFFQASKVPGGGWIPPPSIFF